MLNDDLKKVNDWVFQWKMNFNSDPSKQAPRFYDGHLNKFCLMLQKFVSQY